MARGPIPDKPADRPKVPEVVEMARRYYTKPGNTTGGNLHIALDDGNLEEASIHWCRDRAKEQGDPDGVELASALLQMTTSQRRRVYAHNLYAYQA